MTVPDTSQSVKLPFIDIFKQSELGYEVLANVACEVANVPKLVVNDMVNGRPVTKGNALGVLKILSQYTGKNYTLDTVDIPLLDELPTFPLLANMQQLGN